LPAARGAQLVRGATDSCAMHVGVAGFTANAWSVSLGTTVTWKAALPGDAPTAIEQLPRGAYAHRVARDFWLAAAAGNSGGGALIELDPPGANLSELDSGASVPSGFAAYPLPRRGDRFPVADSRFAGFGVPHIADTRLHGALLEGVAYVVRLGIEQIVSAGVGAPAQLYVTGGGATSEVWTRLLASVVQTAMVARPDAGPDTGAAMLAAIGAGATDAGSIGAGWTEAGSSAVVEPDPLLAVRLDERYAAFLDCLSRLPTAAI
jgi:sugar (pentulose or hexulose) kinase